MSVAIYIDGTDVSNVVVDGSVTRRLNRPAQAQIRIPMSYAIGGVGSPLSPTQTYPSRLKIVINSELFFHGFVLNCETDSEEDNGYTVYNATDPMELWQYRPVRADDGDFTKPSGGPGPDIIADYVTGPQIIEAMLHNSIDTTSGGGGPPNEFAEGPLFLAFGGFEGGGVNLTGAPVDWPMSIMELTNLFISTGEVDVVITPIDSGGNMGQVDVYNGDYGTDLSGTVIFEYGMGAYNVRRIRWNEDMTNMCNKLWYYAGPRIGTAADPAGDQHWCFNITRDDPNLPGAPSSSPYIDVFNLTEDSRADYGVRMEVRIYDAADEDCVPGVGTPGRNLYRRLWMMESWIRAQPRTLIHVTPTRETEIGTFDIGDLVMVRAGTQIRGGFEGAQRIYEYTISWDADGVLELGELQTSSDADGI